MASDGEVSCTNDPNFAVIYSFLKVFGKLYTLEIPSIQKLQELIENTQEVLDPLRDLHVWLLRKALKSIQRNKWEKSVIKFCHQQGYHQEAWEIERFSYKKASVQVKLKVLKVLLEYQFSCHSKFKNAVNSIPSKDLRLEPIGNDKNGRVYWLQVDDEANLRLYREDQDEETWELVARNRDGLLKVINQLKNGEECNVINGSINEESNGIDNTPETKTIKSNEDSNEEFLSPESESEHESDEEKEEKPADIPGPQTKIDTSDIEKAKVEKTLNSELSEALGKSDETCSETVNDSTEQHVNNGTVSEAIEEPVMIVTGEGNGAECESSSFIIGEEIIEPVMYFWGDGYGFENTTGNPDNDESSDPTENMNKDSHLDSNHANGECSGVKTEDTSNRDLNKHVLNSENIKHNITSTSVTKRLLKKLSDDLTDTVQNESDSKKHCIRNVNVDTLHHDNSIPMCSKIQDDVTIGEVCNEEDSSKKSLKNCNSNVLILNNCDKTNTKVKLKEIIDNSTSNPSSPLNENKTNILEKRKNSMSSSDLEEGTTSLELGESTIECDNKMPNTTDSLPTKKLKLDSSGVEVEVTEEKDVSSKRKSKRSVKQIEMSDKLEYSKEDCSNTTNQRDPNDTVINKNSATVNKNNDIISHRKKIKVNRAKLKNHKLFRKTASPKEISVSDNKSNIDNCQSDQNKKDSSRSLKRSLLDTKKRDHSKSQSVSEEETEEQETGGKRLKIKPKKIILSSRKKVEAKIIKDSSSDDSDDETLHAIGKRNGKKLLKKKNKIRKDKTKKSSEEKCMVPGDSDSTPVRQSRRIAQMKIKEEADRRHLEEVALRELKLIHKKKVRKEDGEEEWQASGGGSSSGAEARRRRARSWHSDSTAPASDSDSDEPLFEHEEPDLDFSKSDHEFSPESDLEHGDPVEPLRRARTLEIGKDDGFCVRCGKGDQPEWILLCDQCDAGHHASCLKPVLFLIPDGDWYCPPCQHQKLISALEKELTKFDELVKVVEEKKLKQEQEEAERRQREGYKSKDEIEDKSDTKSKSRLGAGQEREEGEDSSSWSSSSSEGAVYRLRERRQLPVSYRAREYDRLMSSAIKEEYVEPTSSAGNQGRGKDISTIIEAAEEEKLKAERDALEQGQSVEVKKVKRKQRRKPRKLNSLEVPSEDDDETDEDFKDTGLDSSSEDISSDADKNSDTDSRSSDSLPIRRSGRADKKDRTRIVESPEVKKKKGVFAETTSESSDAKEWDNKSKTKMKHRRRHDKPGPKRFKKKRGLTQYDSEGNVIRARVTYGGLSGPEGDNDWSPKHRTRQKKINYTEMPNTESEDEIHKSSGKHMLDSSDEFKIDTDDTSDSDSDRKKRRKSMDSDKANDENHQEALRNLMKKTAIVPLDRLPEDVTKAKTEALEAHLLAQEKAASEAAVGGKEGEDGQAARGRGTRGARGGRGSRGSRGSRRGGPARAHTTTDCTDETLSKLVGVKIKDLTQPSEGVFNPNQEERNKKRLEKEARLAEKEARKLERIQKKEEKEKAKEQKAKEREEKRLARLALQESKRQRKESVHPPIPIGGPALYRPHYPAAPRLQVRPELRAMQPDLANVRAPRPQPSHARLNHPPPHLRDGTLSVAGSPQPFKPVSEEPSVITRMPHMMAQQYRNPMMYPPGGAPYGHGGPRGPHMYPMHQAHAMSPGPPPRHQYPLPGQSYYPQHMRGVPPGYPSRPPPLHGPPPHPHPSHGPQTGPHGPTHHEGPPHPPSPHAGAPHAPPPHAGPPHAPPPHAGPPHAPPPHAGPPHTPSPLAGPPRHAGPHHHAGIPHAPSPHAGSPHHAGPLHAPPPHAGPPHHARPPHAPSPHTGPPHAPSPLAVPPHAPSPHAGQPHALSPHARPPHAPSPHAGPPLHVGPTPNAALRHTPPPENMITKIKSEIKTEPEFSRDGGGSPDSPPREDAPRLNHPKMKHTENKDRRPRFPLGPYAPQYGPYGPYAPPPGPSPAPLYPSPRGYLNPESLPRVPLSPSSDPHHIEGSPLTDLQNVPPAPRDEERPPPVTSHRPPSGDSALTSRPSPVSFIKTECEEDSDSRTLESVPLSVGEGEGAAGRAREEGGVFGGLVSYFSSQREDDIDN